MVATASRAWDKSDGKAGNGNDAVNPGRNNRSYSFVRTLLSAKWICFFKKLCILAILDFMSMVFAVAFDEATPIRQYA